VRYRIEQESGRDTSGNYTFRIYSNDRLVARYWHDYRGDEHGIEFVNGKNKPVPVKRLASSQVAGHSHWCSRSRLRLTSTGSWRKCLGVVPRRAA